MSFILDALKKAESERNRQSGPVLMDVRLAPPRRHLPAWGWVLGAVLLANLAILGWLVLRPSPPADAAPAPPVASAPTPLAVPAAPAVPQPAAPATQAAPPPAAIGEPASSGAQPARPGYFDADALPTAQDLQASGVNLPPLQLNLHAYDPSPEQRYVLLNSVLLREGDYSPDGIKVERITQRGVVLEASGRLFLLVRTGG